MEAATFWMTKGTWGLRKTTTTGRDYRRSPTHEIDEFFPFLSFLFWAFSCPWSPMMTRAYIRWAAGRECPGSTLSNTLSWVILNLGDTQIVSSLTGVGPTIKDSLGRKSMPQVSPNTDIDWRVSGHICGHWSPQIICISWIRDASTYRTDDDEYIV